MTRIPIAFAGFAMAAAGLCLPTAPVLAQDAPPTQVQAQAQAQVPADGPLGFLQRREGRIWVAQTGETDEQGRRFIDARIYRGMLGGNAVSITKLRIYPGGDVATYLEGIYYMEPGAGQLRQTAVSVTGEMISDLTYQTGNGGGHIYSFTLTSSSGAKQDWTIREGFNDEGYMLEELFMWSGESWDSVTARVFIPVTLETDLSTLFPAE